MNTREFVNEITLGGKAKNFRWKLDEVGDLLIERKFKNSSKVEISKIPVDELERIINYVGSDNWIDLANNVEKLKKGEEKPGIGRFMYDELGYNETQCQTASQLGPVLTNAGIWEYNGKKRNIQFRTNNKEWEKLLQAYYERHLSKNIYLYSIF